MAATTDPVDRTPILASWKVSEALARYPQLLDVLVGLSPAFHHLRNPALRRVQTRLVTVAQAARVAGLEPAVVVRTLNVAAGLGADGASEPEGAAPPSVTPTPAAAALVAEEVDARPLLARGEEPFRAIMAAAGRVPPGQALRLRAPFEPVPLYDVLGQRGFTHAAHQLGPDDWEVLFIHGADGAPPAPKGMNQPLVLTAAPVAEAAPDAVLRVDVSDLVPPEPMVRILEAAAQLQPGQTLLVEHVRRPVYLYPQLDAQGFAHQTEEPEPGRVLIRITRPAGGPG
jgi:uncharacterized protein (DUF2249 family)